MGHNETPTEKEIKMNPYDRELLVRVAPTYIIAAVVGVATFIQLREIKRQAKRNRAEHALRMEEMEKVASERMERFRAWRAAQPKIAEEYIKKAKEEIGSPDDIRRKINDPNYTWGL